MITAETREVVPSCGSDPNFRYKNGLKSGWLWYQFTLYLKGGSTSRDNNINNASLFSYRAVCFPMAERQPFYKYIIASLFLAICLEFSRFFEFKLTPNNSMYITTCMAENPYYVQYNSYWNEIFATGLVPLILLCYMNLKIFQKIKVRTYFLIFARLICSLRRDLKIYPDFYKVPPRSDF